jgi:hypothetical protein
MTPRVALAVALGVSLLLTGCARPPAQSATSVPVLTTAQDTPVDAVASFVAALRAHLQAQAAGDVQSANAIRDRIGDTLITRQEFLDRYHALARGFARPDAVAVAEHVENWAAALAFYVAGFDLNAAIATPERGGNRAIVQAPARSARDAALVQFVLLQGGDHKWRVQAIDFVPPARTAAPATASAPGSAPARAPASRAARESQP